MIIRKLVIYGFGKHENVTIDLDSKLSVFFGMNEAGKTTIQQFILQMLFGFPQKNSTWQRYEPKKGGTYGGQLHIEDPEYGKCVIERVRGKAAGDVTVRFGDGKTGGEEAVRTLLRGYDRASFESVFSFSLLQLQGFESMNEDELSRTLLASGTTGVDTVLKLEERLEKEMGALFKKNGRVPVMNVKLAELKDLEQKVKQERERAEGYAPAMNRLKEIGERLRAIDEEEKGLADERRKFSLHLQLQPLFEKESLLADRLHALGGGTGGFPADGKRRYESLQERIAEAAVRHERLEKEAARMEEELGKLPLLPVHEVERLLFAESEWHDWRSAAKSLADEKRMLEEKRRRLLADLGLPQERLLADLAAADVSLAQEQRMRTILREHDEAAGRAEFAKRQLDGLEMELESLEHGGQKLAAEAPSDEEMAFQADWREIEKKLAEARAYVQFHKEPRATGSKIPAVLFMAALLFGVYGIVSSQWVIAAGSVLLAGLGIFLLRSARTQNGDAAIREREAFIQRHEEKERRSAAIFSKVAAYERSLAALDAERKTAERKYAAALSDFDQRLIEKKNAEHALHGFLRQYGFEELPDPSIVPDLFKMIRGYQDVTHELKETESRRADVAEQMKRRHEEAVEALGRPVAEESLYEELREEAGRRKEAEMRRRTLLDELSRLRADLDEAASLAGSLREQVSGLFQEAGAKTEEAFYKAYDVHEETSEIKGRLEDIRSQLKAYRHVTFDTRVTRNEIEEKAVQAENAITKLTDERLSLLEEKAELVHLTDELVHQDTYERLLQQFEMKRAEFSDLAKEWAEKKAVVEAIRRTMSDLKEDTLPAVLRAAGDFFSELTGDRYEALSVDEDGRFHAVTAAGERYSISELSQATKEQAYIAMRLALAGSLRQAAPFPIVMDDPFVHFDGVRLARMVNLIERLKGVHQFIYFTCHESMAESIAEAKRIDVSEIGIGKGAVLQ